MARIYNPAIGASGGFDSAQVAGPIVPNADFPDLAQITSIRQRYVQLSTYYTAPTQSSTTLYGGVTFYLANDDNFQDVGAGCIMWEREWARIPGQRVIWEGLDYAMPAVSQQLITFGTTYSVSSAAQSATGSATMTVAVASTATLNLGQAIGLQWLRGGTTYSQANYQMQSIVTVGSNKIVVIYPINLDFVASATTGRVLATMVAGTFRVQPTNLATRAKLTFDYFLPGISAAVTLPSDITIYQRFKVTNSIGAEIQIIDGGSTPTANTWASWVSDPINNLQEAQDSLFQLWKGAIYERKRVQFAPL